ncbi:MAG: hypothetical protein JW959_04035 [Pirellulales bacterium]|nr:hypothetical protein [Pirellulales bacterium]
MDRRVVLASAAFAAALAMFSGCGPDRPTTAPVGGKITYQGKPVAEGTIIFYPKHGRLAIGKIGPDGAYRLTTFTSNDGAAPGLYVVTIEAKQVSGGYQPKSLEDELKKGFGAPTIIWLAPQIYAERETSTLTAEVKPGENTIDFDLP